MKIPKHFLRHTVTVENATSTWGTFESSRSVKCLISYEVSSQRTETGIERNITAEMYLDPDDTITEGSKITLPDGTVGYASAVVNHSGGGLPTPDHIMVPITFGTVAGPVYGESVTLVTRTVSGLDDYGNDLYVTSSTVYPSCQVIFDSTDEYIDNGRNPVTTTITVVFPPGTSVTASDRVIVRSETYGVQGNPDTSYSNMTGTTAGVNVRCIRVSG